LSLRNARGAVSDGAASAWATSNAYLSMRHHACKHGGERPKAQEGLQAARAVRLGCARRAMSEGRYVRAQQATCAKQRFARFGGVDMQSLMGALNSTIIHIPAVLNKHASPTTCAFGSIPRDAGTFGSKISHGIRNIVWPLCI